MKSIGKILKAEREKNRYTLQDVQKVIKIHPNYIKALESDDYEIFEGKVHAKGFLKMYAEYLGLDLGEIMALWRRDYENIFDKSKSERLFNIEQVPDSKRLVITPKIILIGFFVILTVGFFSYLTYQYRTFTGNPELEVYSPENNRLVSSDLLDVTGKSDLDSEVFINGQKVILQPNGSFATSIKLKEGINTLSVSAVNSLNKKSEEIRTVIYRPPENQNSFTPPEAWESTETTESSESVIF